ncbi:MAG: transglutaminase-like domain-containing protein [Verrucomicrobiae bacterium]|nr:transglutaminase-like domain-containing protein [Verrucomicrobiae bacterium]
MLTTTLRKAVAEPTPPVVDAEHLALIKLLGDEDPFVYHAVREKIISMGTDTQIWLKPCQTSNDATVRRHAKEIVRHFDQSGADTRFMSYCLQEPKSIDLEQGALLLAQTEYPDLDAVAYSAALDTLAQELREWLATTDPQQRLLPRVNQFLFDEKGFTGNMENYYDPENTFINRVLDRRTGNPVSLCLLYTLLMRRLDYPVHPIGLPGHSVCQFKDANDEVYIDAFNLGKLLTRHDCIEHLKRCKHEVRDEYLEPMTARRALARMCGNLEQIYMELRRTADSGRYQRYLFALTR